MTKALKFCIIWNINSVSPRKRGVCAHNWHGCTGDPLGVTEWCSKRLMGTCCQCQIAHPRSVGTQHWLYWPQQASCLNVVKYRRRQTASRVFLMDREGGKQTGMLCRCSSKAALTPAGKRRLLLSYLPSFCRCGRRTSATKRPAAFLVAPTLVLMVAVVLKCYRHEVLCVCCQDRLISPQEDGEVSTALS